MKIFNNLNVDNVYCLYLEEFTERKEKAILHFSEKNIQVEMFKGTYYRDKGHYGCKMGHLDIIQDAKNKNYENILILEDDVLFENNLPININVPLDFGLFYLSYYEYDNLSIKDKNSDKYMKESKYNLMRMFYTRSTISYIVNKKIYDNILSVREFNTHYNEFIDMFYANKIQNQYKCYGLYPLVCSVNCSKSTINNIESKKEQKEIRDKILESAKKTFEKPTDNNFCNLVEKGKKFIYDNRIFLS